MSENTDPYTYPGTNVLRNLRGIRDLQTLLEFEAEASTRRIEQAITQPATGRLDARHLKAIHKHIFQDVYAWAGEFRSVNISRDGHLFANADFILPALDEILAKLAREEYLGTHKTQSFVQRAAFYLSEINAVHPFREGNGRTQREFIRQLGLNAGFAVDWSRIARDQMLEASRESFRSGNTPAWAALIRRCLVST